MALQNDAFFFLIYRQLMRHPVLKLFYLFNLIQMANDPRMVDVEFLRKFSCSCKEISFNDCFQLFIVNFWWPATMLLSFKIFFSFAKLFETSLHCMFISNAWAKSIADFASCLHCFSSHLNSKKTVQICFLSNIIALV